MKAGPTKNHFPSSLQLRAAEPEDAVLLWQWANDPQVRMQSLHPDPIALETHLHWYTAKLQSPLTRIWIVCLAEEAVAQIRYDVVAPALAEIDYSVSLAHRGKGIGTAMLNETHAPTCAALGLSEVHGIVRTSNPASARAFEKAGFRRIGAVVRKGYDCIVYAKQFMQSNKSAL